MTFVDERQLIERIADDDTEAFKIIMKQNKNKMYRVAIGILQNKQAAEDVVQDAFVKLWQLRKEFELTSKLSTWLYRVTFNRAISIQRRDKLLSFFSKLTNNSIDDDDKVVAFDEQLEDKSLNSSKKIENEQIKKALKIALNSLPKNQRLAFVLSKYEDLSYKEIAEIMDLSLTSVESLIHRAKQNLQKKLLKTYKNLN